MIEEHHLKNMLDTKSVIGEEIEARKAKVNKKNHHGLVQVTRKE
jgi:hypothetical protein